jgi:hypothetical protein
MFDNAPKKRVHGDYDRRWLSDDFFDLIIWYRPDDTIYGFQLCYDKPYWERALTRMCDKGFSQARRLIAENKFTLPTKLQSLFPMDLSLRTQSFTSSCDAVVRCLSRFDS